MSICLHTALLLFLRLFEYLAQRTNKNKNLTGERTKKKATHKTTYPNFNTKPLLFQHVLILTTVVEGQRLHLQYHGQCMEKFYHLKEFHR